MKRKVALHSLGCKVNSYETESMRKMLCDAGYEIVDFENDIADIYIINTCSVTNIADRKSRQMLHRAKKLNENAIVVAAGCYVQAEGEALLKDEAVDLIIGNNMKINIVEALADYFGDNSNNSEYIDIGTTNEYEPLTISEDTEHTRAFIKIQDGCNQFCTYCIIPYTRGRIRSRKYDDVMEEVSKVAQNGYREIVLTGIHISSYGKDKEDGVGLIELIEGICKIDGIDRVRLGSLEPRIVTREFAERLAAQKKICPHFHLSLQSGCDTVLKRMNRKYDTAEYAAGCDILREYFDNPAITTDVIVGFPGETEEEFAVTRDFLEKTGFYEMHVFKYSRRKGTVADRMPDQIEESVKSHRSNVLLALNTVMSDGYRNNWINKKSEVLIERQMEFEGEKYYIGHTKEYIEVALQSDKNLVNSILEVSIQEKLKDEIWKCTCTIS